MATATALQPKTKAEPALKIVANRKSLLAALAVTAPVANGRVKEILANVLISCDPNHSTVLATDMTVVARQSFEATVDHPGSVLAPAQVIKSMLSQMTDELVRLDVDPKTKALTIRGERTQHKLATANPKDFCAVPDPKWTAECRVPASQFVAYLKAVAPQVGDSDYKGYAIHSLMVEFCDNTLALAGTDGRAGAAAEFQAEPSNRATALVPYQSVRVMSSIADGELTLKISENWIAVESETGVAMSRLNEGRFPKWRDFLMAHGDFQAEITPSAMASLIRRVCVVSPDAMQGPCVTLKISDGTLSAKCNVSGFDSESEITISNSGTLDADINWKYLLDAMTGLLAVSDMPATIKGSRPIVIHRDELTFSIVPLTRE